MKSYMEPIERSAFDGLVERLESGTSGATGEDGQYLMKWYGDGEKWDVTGFEFFVC